MVERCAACVRAVTSISQNLDVPKNTQKELLDQVEKDLEQALTTGYLQTNLSAKGRATKFAGYAFTNRSLPVAEKYQQAADAAQKVIDGPFSLPNNYWDNSGVAAALPNHLRSFFYRPEW
jgi:hypothetical protein